eukprot:scaffold11360_cov114-Isochrysis_galbana.AAC.1
MLSSRSHTRAEAHVGSGFVDSAGRLGFGFQMMQQGRAHVSLVDQPCGGEHFSQLGGEAAVSALL